MSASSKTTDSRKLMTESEAASYLNIQPGTLASWRVTKRYPLKYIKIGRSVRYRLSDLRDFEKSREHISEEAKPTTSGTTKTTQTELLKWFTDTSMPYEGHLVLLESEDSEFVEQAYFDGQSWCSFDDSPIERKVVAWAYWPLGTRGAT